MMCAHRYPTTLILGLLAWLACGLAACTGAGNLNVVSGAPLLASETPVPSATIVWFPPSATPPPQVFPTYTGTPERRPDVGRVVLSDDFSSSEDWDTAASDEGSAAVSRNRLTLAVQPGFSIASLRKETILGDFYAEITARPSLCRGADSYGFMVRAPNNVAAYRFALSCDGSARVERYSIGRAHPLQPPVPSGDVPRGAPGQVRLGVWAVGTEMRFFLNGRYQFAVKDTSYESGGIGVFADSAGDTPVTITFSDLVVSAVTYILPTRTPLP